MKLFNTTKELGKLNAQGDFSLIPSYKGMIFIALCVLSFFFAVIYQIHNDAQDDTPQKTHKFNKPYNKDFLFMNESPEFRHDWRRKSGSFGIDDIDAHSVSGVIPSNYKEVKNEVKQRLNNMSRKEKFEFETAFKKEKGRFSKDQEELSNFVASNKDLVNKAREKTKSQKIVSLEEKERRLQERQNKLVNLQDEIDKRSKKYKQKEKENLNNKAHLNHMGHKTASRLQSPRNQLTSNMGLNFLLAEDPRYSGSIKPMSRYSLVKGREIEVVLLNTVYSSSHKDGGGTAKFAVLQNVYSNGVLILPVGTVFLAKVNKGSENGAIRVKVERINMYAHKKTIKGVWDKRVLCRIPVKGDIHAMSGRLGLPGGYTKSFTWEQIQAQLPELVGTMVLLSQESERDINGQTHIPNTPSNNVRALIAQTLQQTALQKKATLQKELMTTISPAGLKCKVFLTEDLDLNPWIGHLMDEFEAFKEEKKPITQEELSKKIVIDYTK